jgi:hypothetical protein
MAATCAATDACRAHTIDTAAAARLPHDIRLGLDPTASSARITPLHIRLCLQRYTASITAKEHCEPRLPAGCHDVWRRLPARLIYLLTRDHAKWAAMCEELRQFS